MHVLTYLYMLTTYSMSTTIPSDSISTDQNIRIDLREFIKWIEQDFEPKLRRETQDGRYARHPEDNEAELYGACDMASVLYSIDRLDLDASTRQAWSTAINRFQTEPHGWFRETSPTHSTIHNTAFALSTLELLGAKPRSPVTLDTEYTNAAAYLHKLDWKKGVYPDSHFGAGIGSICYFVEELRTPVWFEDYFATCDALIDSRNGLMGIDKPTSGDTDQIGGSFHYAFIYAHFNRHLPFPEARIDTILSLQDSHGFWDENNQLWLTLDALYLLTRATRQTPHRFQDIKASARKVATHLNSTVFSPKGQAAAFNGMLPTHSLCAAITAAAELQNFLGSHEIITEHPLRNIIDRRPFI